jgi:hypothetical protein
VISRPNPKDIVASIIARTGVFVSSLGVGDKCIIRKLAIVIPIILDIGPFTEQKEY